MHKLWLLSMHLVAGQTAGSCCGPKKLQAGQRPAVHCAVTVDDVITVARPGRRPRPLLLFWIFGRAVMMSSQLRGRRPASPEATSVVLDFWSRGPVQLVKGFRQTD